MHIDIEYKQNKMAAASISTLFLDKSHGRQELGWRYISSTTMSKILLVLFVSNKWYCGLVSWNLCPIFRCTLSVELFIFAGCTLQAEAPCGQEMMVDNNHPPQCKHQSKPQWVTWQGFPAHLSLLKLVVCAGVLFFNKLEHGTPFAVNCAEGSE